MSLVINQPLTQVNRWDFENDWDHDICGFCENCSTLICACCCWPIFICSLPHRLGESRCMLCCVPHPLLPMRTKARSVLQIRVILKIFVLSFNSIQSYLIKGIYSRRLCLLFLFSIMYCHSIGQ